MTGKILLILPESMSSTNGGTILFRTLISNLDSDEFNWVAVGGGTSSVPDWLQRSEGIVIRSVLFNRYLAFLLRRSAFKRFYARLIFVVFSRYSARKIVKFVDKKKPIKLWVWASGHTIPTATRVLAERDIPVHVTIQDDIDGHNFKHEADMLRSDFEMLIRRATTLDVTSDAMKEYYVQKYGLGHDAYVLWNGAVDLPTPAPPTIRRRIRRIGYAGNLWAPDNFRNLLGALELINEKRRSGDQVSFDILSPRLPKHFMINSKHLRYMGAAPFEKIALILQDYDLLFVPMSFDPAKEVLCRTSLPGKMLVYMKAQVPLFAHGPAYASNVNFVRANNIGAVCVSSRVTDIADAIVKYESNFDLRVEHSRNCRYLCDSKFDAKKVWEAFKEVLYRTKR